MRKTDTVRRGERASRSFDSSSLVRTYGTLESTGVYSRPKRTDESELARSRSSPSSSYIRHDRNRAVRRVPSQQHGEHKRRRPRATAAAESAGARPSHDEHPGAQDAGQGARREHHQRPADGLKVNRGFTEGAHRRPPRARHGVTGKSERLETPLDPEESTDESEGGGKRSNEGRRFARKRRRMIAREGLAPIVTKGMIRPCIGRSRGLTRRDNRCISDDCRERERLSV